jgi:hypothetical protein
VCGTGGPAHKREARPQMGPCIQSSSGLPPTPRRKPAESQWTPRNPRVNHALATESRYSPKQVKATITASIQYCDRAASR